MNIVTLTRLPSLLAAPALVAALASGQEPALPPGLFDGSQAPSLPPGLSASLGSEEEGPDGPTEDPVYGSGGLLSLAKDPGVKGFLDNRFGVRTQSDRRERAASIAEMRLRVEAERRVGSLFLRGSTDLIVDPLFDSWAPDLESGQGFADLREAYVDFSPLPWLDVKAGRQVLTWGTGDLPFINDLFPKDFVSFFTGRDDEYLKVPSDAVRVGVFSDIANVDLVYTPRFDADRFITGRRVSFFNPLLDRRTGRDAILETEQPDQLFGDSEWAARIYRSVGSYELAAYGYLGFWKTPSGFNSENGKALFPRLAVYGASVRTQLAGGIASLEVGYYDSRQDAGGDDPFIENSQTRLLVGFERDLPGIADSFSVGVQYFLEAMANHDEYERTLPEGFPVRDELRHVVVLRATKLLLDQRLRASVFTFSSPSDRDTYIKPNISYAVNDSWTVTVGGNFFAGADGTTFIGQFGPNTNVFAALRFSF